LFTLGDRDYLLLLQGKTKTTIMKKILIATFMLVALQSMGQSERFMASMQACLQQMKDANTPDAMIALEAKFERIADAEKNQWLPYYYAGTLKTRLSMQHAGGDPDKLADDADLLAAKADSLSPKNSEIYCLKSMVASSKMLVDPQTRWMKYGATSNQCLEMAKKLDSTNPRPFVLQSIGLKSMPEQFGGGCGQAKPLAIVAEKLFASFKPASDISPNWGKEIVDGILSDCK